MRTRLVKLVTFLAGLYFLLEFLLPKFVLQAIGVESAHESISQGFVLVGTMAAGLGIINLFMVHGSRIVFKRSGWLYSTALLFGLVLMMTVACADWMETYEVEQKGSELAMLSEFAIKIDSDEQAKTDTALNSKERIKLLLESARKSIDDIGEDIKSRSYDSVQNKSDLENYSIEYFVISESTNSILNTLEEANHQQEFPKSELSAAAVGLGELSVASRQFYQVLYESGTVHNLWNFLFEGIFVSLGSAMFSLLGVYIASAAYRAFRIQSFESALMMFAAVLVMLGQIPFGVWIYDGMPDIRQWLLEYPNSASFRAIKIGVGVATLVMSFRMWLSLESDFSEKKAQ